MSHQTIDLSDQCHGIIWTSLASCCFCILLINNKPINFVGDHPMNIPSKFGSNWPSGFREKDIKCLRTTMMDANWWKYLKWPSGADELKVVGVRVYITAKIVRFILLQRYPDSMYKSLPCLSVQKLEHYPSFIFERNNFHDRCISEINKVKHNNFAYFWFLHVNFKWNKVWVIVVSLLVSNFTALSWKEQVTFSW